MHLRSLARSGLFAAALLATGLAAGCQGERALTLPDPTIVTSWFGEPTEARIDGNLLEIRGVLDDDYLQRGGRIWARSSPYFYLFNVHVEQLLREYPDLAAVRAVVLTEDGREIARAQLHRDTLNGVRWQEALARSSLAQLSGTDNPRHLERLIHYGEDHTRFEYDSELAR